MERFSLTASVAHMAQGSTSLSARYFESENRKGVVGDTKREITIERIDWPSIGYIVRGGFAISRNSIKPLAQLTTTQPPERGRCSNQNFHFRSESPSRPILGEKKERNEDPLVSFILPNAMRKLEHLEHFFSSWPFLPLDLSFRVIPR